MNVLWRISHLVPTRRLEMLRVYIEAKLQSYGRDLCIRDSELGAYSYVGLCAYELIRTLNARVQEH